VARSKALAEWLLPRSLTKTPAKSRSSDPQDNPQFQEIWNVVAAIPRGQVSTTARSHGQPDCLAARGWRDVRCESRLKR
jgi:hypothetical protein